MKPLPCLCLATLLLTVTTSSGKAADKPKGHDGTWKPAIAELGGMAFPEEVMKSMKLVIEGNKYTVTVNDSVDKGTTKVDPTAKPKTMDITGTEGPNKGKTFLAIYEENGDTMRICYDLSGKSRPKEFKTTKGQPLMLITWKREKN